MSYDDLKLKTIYETSFFFFFTNHLPHNHKLTTQKGSKATSFGTLRLAGTVTTIYTDDSVCGFLENCY